MSVRRKNQMGSMIVAALMLFSIILALGLGLMSSQRGRMEAAKAQAASVKAKALAYSAWEDVRTKLSKDLFFPPVSDVKRDPLNPTAPLDENFYSYSENVYDSDGELFGTYTVVIDTHLHSLSQDGRDDPTVESEVMLHDSIYIIDCIGKVGIRNDRPEAERTLHIELDMQNFKVIRFEDRGGI